MDLYSFKKINENVKEFEEKVLMSPKYFLKDFGEDNLYLAVMNSIVFKPSLTLQIEQMFNRNKAKYTIAAEEHPYYNMIKNSYCSVDIIELALKLLGIFAVEGDKSLLELIKKGWPKIFNALERYRLKDDSSLLHKELQLQQSIEEMDRMQIMLIFYNKVYKMQSDDYPLGINLKNDVGVTSIFKAIVFPDGPLKSSVQEEILEGFKHAFKITESNYNKADYYLKDYGKAENMLNKLMNFATASYINPGQILDAVIDPDIMNEIICIESLEAARDIALDEKDIIIDLWVAIFIAYIGQEYRKLKSRYFKLKEEKSTVRLYQEIKENKKENKQLKAELSKKEKALSSLDTELQLEKNKNRKSDAKKDKAYNDLLKEAETKFKKELSSLEKENLMLRDMLEDLMKEKESIAELAIDPVSFDDKLELIKNTSGILFVCKEESGAALAKLKRLREIADNIKFYTSENDVVPSDVSYIFFDYHLINHGIYQKVKNVGKRRSIPLYYIQDIKADNNISEMYTVIKQSQ